MKTASPALRGLIESGQFGTADLYTITLIDGTVIRLTSADRDLMWNLNNYSHNKLKVQRDGLSQALGLEVDTLNLNVFPEPLEPFIEDNPFGKCVRIGLLDGATIKLEKGYIKTWALPVVLGVLHKFEGSISDIEGGDRGYSIPVKSILELMNMNMPANLYQTSCRHVVYSPQCGVNREAFTVTGEITSVTNKNIFDTNLSQPDGYFDLGVIAFTSGVNNGSRRTVKRHVSGELEFSLPLVHLPQVGDDFTIYPGCQRTQSVCKDKFNNLLSFKAYPYVPKPETLY